MVGAVHPNRPLSHRDQLLLPARITTNEKWPFFGARDETRAHWIVQNVIRLFSQAFIFSHAMIKIIALPFNARVPRRNSFEIADDI